MQKLLVFLFAENGRGGERKKASYLGCVRHPRKAKKEKENSRGEILSSSSVGDNGVITWVFEENSFIPTAKLKNNKKFSILADHLGTPTSMYNEEGETVWERSLNTFGGVKEGNHGACPFMYQGQYYDKEIELAYNRFRYYNPEAGRYISKDPLGLFSGENNFYSYVGDPNGFVDRFGLHKTYSELDQMSIDAANRIKNTRTRNMTTVAVGKDANGNLYVSTSKPYTPKEVRAWADENNATVVNSRTADVHAEESLHNFSGTQMTEVGSSKPICIDCENGMNANNISHNSGNTSGKKSKKRAGNGNTGMW